MVYTTRLAGGKGGRNRFENRLRELGVQQKNSTPNHPTTCGKVERYQQTMKNWPRARPPSPNCKPSTAYATTRSTKQASSPCEPAADYTTSASAEPTPQPPSPCSSPT
jgi:hypothetical protein